MRSLTVALVLFASPLFAACPDAPDIGADLDDLVAAAQEAENDMVGRAVSARMWALWLTAPDEAAQAVLDRGMRARASYDYAAALDAFTRLAEYCPDYAEGFNQRAYIFFLTEDYARALDDLDAALALSPRHVGALSGRALTLMKLGRLAEARTQLRAALKLNPWLSERYLLAEGGPLAPAVDEI